MVTADTRLSPDILSALGRRWPTVELPPSVISSYACPNAAQDLGRERRGAAFVTSPWAAVAVG